jgi:hypothetical protein
MHSSSRAGHALRRSGRLAGLAASTDAATAPSSAAKTRKRAPPAAIDPAVKKRPGAPAKKAAPGPTRDMERALWAKGYDRVAGA